MLGAGLSGGGETDKCDLIYENFPALRLNSDMNPSEANYVLSVLFPNCLPLDESLYAHISPGLAAAHGFRLDGKNKYAVSCRYGSAGDVGYTDATGSQYLVHNRTIGSLLIQLCDDLIPPSENKDALMSHLREKSDSHPQVTNNVHKIYENFPDTLLNLTMNPTQANYVLSVLFPNCLPLDGSLYVHISPELAAAHGFSLDVKMNYAVSCRYDSAGEITYTAAGRHYSVQSGTIGALLIQLCTDLLPSSGEKTQLIRHLTQMSDSHPQITPR